MRNLCILCLSLLCIIVSCKSNKAANQTEEGANQQVETPKTLTDIYPWLKGTWISSNAYSISGNSITCKDVWGKEKWRKDFTIEDNCIIVDGGKEFKISLDEEKVISLGGFPLIKYESFTLPPDYNWIKGLWCDGRRFVYVADNEQIAFYDEFGKESNKGIFVIDKDGDLNIFLQRESEDEPYIVSIKRLKRLAYEGSEVNLWKITSDAEKGKIIEWNKKKRIIGSWINKTHEHDAFHLIFNEDGTGRTAMVLNERIITDDRFKWIMEGDVIYARNVSKYHYIESSDEIKDDNVDGGYYKRNRHVQEREIDYAVLENLIIGDFIEDYDGVVQCTVNRIRTISLPDYLALMISSNGISSETKTKLESLKQGMREMMVDIYEVGCASYDEGIMSSAYYIVNYKNKILGKVSGDYSSGVIYASDDKDVYFSWGSDKVRTDESLNHHQ